jgi:hypothetical protein
MKKNREFLTKMMTKIYFKKEKKVEFNSDFFIIIQHKKTKKQNIIHSFLLIFFLFLTIMYY